MPRTLAEVAKDALELQFEERMQLIEELRDSVMTDEEREIEQAWIEEAERRMREIENGTAKMIPGDEVLSNLREKLLRRRLESGEDPGLTLEEFWSDED